MSKDATEREVQLFKQSLEAFDTLKIKMIRFEGLGTNIFLLGIKIEQPVECFIASYDGLTHPFNKLCLLEIAKTFENRSSFSGSLSYKVKAHQNAVIDDDYYKCCGKIALNCLAHLRGKAFVLQQQFAPLRKWIVNGGENNFAIITPNNNAAIKDLFPQDSHQVIITKAENMLFADVCFYNHFHNLVRLTDNFSDPFPLNGFICDWKEKKEFNYYDYLLEYTKKQKS